MFSMVTLLRVPTAVPRLRMAPGSNVWTWIFTIVSSPMTTVELARTLSWARRASGSRAVPLTRSCVQ